MFAVFYLAMRRLLKVVKGPCLLQCTCMLANLSTSCSLDSPVCSLDFFLPFLPLVLTNVVTHDEFISNMDTLKTI